MRRSLADDAGDDRVSEAQLWQAIDATRRANPDAHCAALAAALAKRPLEQIFLFDREWEQALQDAYTWRLWGAAYLIGGGASDDGFEYFRDWLILEGRHVYRAALADPDVLDSVLQGRSDPAGYQYECYPAISAWQRKTGSNDFGAFDTAETAAFRKLGLSQPAPRPNPAGRQWNFDSAAEDRRYLPRLTAHYFG